MASSAKSPIKFRFTVRDLDVNNLRWVITYVNKIDATRHPTVACFNVAKNGGKVTASNTLPCDSFTAIDANGNPVVSI